MKFISLAILLLGASLAVIPEAWSASSAFDQTKVMVENARLSDAEEMLQQWLAGHLEDQEARFLLARVFAWQGKNNEALLEYERLLEKEPDNGEYLEGKALLPLKPQPQLQIEAPHPQGLSLDISPSF
ncbi:MAG: tetratricopeptide repeat protein [Sulfuricella sp.]